MEASEFSFALEIANLPVVVHMINDEVVNSHTHFDGASVDEISTWLVSLIINNKK